MQESSYSENNFEQCIKCTICTAYCPVVPVNPLYPGPKQSGPDGERLRLKNGFFYDENIKYCMNCKRCELACPSGVRIADIIHSARARYSNHKTTLRDIILANTDLMGSVARPFAPVVNAVVSSKPAKAAMSGLIGVHKKRTFPAYQFSGFEKWYRKNKKVEQGSYSKQVAYFHTCSTEYQHPEVGKAFVELMNAVGYGVQIMDEKCCGVAMISNGLFKQAAKNAAHNLAEFRKFVPKGVKIVTTASTCTFTIREEYPHVLNVDNSDVKDSVILFEKFLFDLIDRNEVKLVFKDNLPKRRIAYHVPCHMAKLGWSMYTKELLKMVPGLDLQVLDSNCCGIAGTYGFKKENYNFSQEIGKPLFEQIKSLNPESVTCECDTCKWQIEMSTGYNVLNPVLLLLESIDIEKTKSANC